MKKSIYTYYKPQEVFEETKKKIRNCFDLELTLIEQVRLKQYVIPTLENLEEVSLSSGDRFNPVSEVMTRFMHDYYGILVTQKLLNRYTNCLPNYLKQIQEQSHLP